MPDITPTTQSPGSAADRSAAMVAAILVWMAIWWMTEAVNLSVTALLPLLLFPLSGVSTIQAAADPYANKIIFLFLGGFVLAMSLERWNLHRRVAIGVLMLVGSKPRGIVFGFMVAASFASLWVSNTATAVMMLPIAVSVMKLVEDVTGREDKNFRAALVLSVAYGASIGSFGTIIASPPNAFAVGYLAEQGINITFTDWMLTGIPLWVCSLVIAWVILTFVAFRPKYTEAIPGVREKLREELTAMGPMSTQEKGVAGVFIFTAFAWIFHGPIFSWLGMAGSTWDKAITDEGIAMMAVFLLFLWPASWKHPGKGLMEWKDLLDLPWGILLLFGGGLSIAGQVQASGLAGWIGESAQGLGGLPPFLLILVCGLLTWVMTEFMSNTAAAATLIPMFGSVAIALGMSPVYLAIPVAMACSCAFMMPAGTPPNAVAFSSGYVSITQMNRGGVLIAIAGVFLVTLNMYFWGMHALGIS
jgi:sodium-dependent dicarboxylate transporter 2/3/5